MLRKMTCASLAALGMTILAAAPASAQPQHYHVQYRSPSWQERVFSSHLMAHEFVDLKRSQGFEAYVVHHGSHFHARFRLLNWRTYRTVSCHIYAHELEDMLRDRGYQTRVVHH